MGVSDLPAASFGDALDEFLDLHGKTIRPSSKYVPRTLSTALMAVPSLDRWQGLLEGSLPRKKSLLLYFSVFREGLGELNGTVKRCWETIQG
jgi:hypothetical protein